MNKITSLAFEELLYHLYDEKYFNNGGTSGLARHI